MNRIKDAVSVLRGYAMSLVSTVRFCVLYLKTSSPKDKVMIKWHDYLKGLLVKASSSYEKNTLRELVITIRKWSSLKTDAEKTPLTFDLGYGIAMLGGEDEGVNTGQGINLMEMAVSLWEQAGDFWSVWYGADTLGNFFRDTVMDYGRATQYFRKAADAIKSESSEVFIDTVAAVAITYMMDLNGDAADKQEKAIDCCREALEAAGNDTGLKIEALMLSGFIKRSITTGSINRNSEEAISFYKEALSLRAREVNPQAYADLHHFIGEAYLCMKTPDRQENIENAISHLSESLEYYTYQRNPEGRAEIMMHLGKAYSERTADDKTRNLIRAGACLKDTLKAYDRDIHPDKYSEVMFMLGKINNSLATEDEDALQIASNCLDEAISSATDAMQWAEPAWLLAQIHSKSGAIEDRQKAFMLYNSLFDVYPRHAEHKKWGELMIEFGVLCREMPSGNSIYYEDMALRSLNAALGVFDKKETPEEWRNCMYALGFLYSRSRTLNLSDIVEEAIGCFECSLELLDKNEAPYPYARACSELATLYQRRAEGNPKENIELSIDYARKGIKHIEERGNACEKIDAHADLAYGLMRRLKDDEASNINKAIEVFSEIKKIISSAGLGDDYIICINSDTAIACDRLYRLKKSTEARDRAAAAYMEFVESFKNALSKMPTNEDRQKYIEYRSYMFDSVNDFLASGDDYEFKLDFIKKADSPLIVEKINTDDFIPRRRTLGNMKGFWGFSASVKEMKEAPGAPSGTAVKTGKGGALLQLKRGARIDLKTKAEDRPTQPEMTQPNPAPVFS
jgi:tetratricopeptide (TPR) repeat protein